jgi:hypothetical protein
MLISNLSLNIPTIIVSIIAFVVYMIIKFHINTQNINVYGVGLVYIFTLINILLLIIGLSLNVFSLIVNVKDAANNMIMLLANVIFIVFFILVILFR